ncbi:MAG: hypothetical protein QG656_2556, partial [Candidatus Hydrogenedentes bacterium]|nr:hypothetical protein [Candidatus Hydrogenedentota bacterium]
GESEAKRVSIPVCKDEPASAVAIVGMAAHFGPWKSLRAFQERVLGGDADAQPSENRRWWGVEQSAWFRELGWTGDDFKGFYLDELTIPLNRFRIPPKELEELLPQQLLMLDVAADALDDVHSPKSDPLRSGVYIGLGMDLNTTNYTVRWALQEKARAWADELGLALTDDELAEWAQQLRDAAMPPLTANRTMGGLASVVASRVAREFRCGGPSFTISSEETSGLCALDAAVRALESGEIEQAIVGAVDLAGDVRAVLTRDARANDLPVGEGAAAVILKRLDDALDDGDRVYAVVRGSDVGLQAASSGAERCTLGGAQSDIGHAGAASGLADLVKACLCLYQEVIPPFRGKDAETPRNPRYWLRDRADGPRRAVVAAAGSDGSAVRVLLDSFDESKREIELRDPLGARREALFVAPAGDVAGLSESLRDLAAMAGEAQVDSIERLARSWWRRMEDRTDSCLAVTLVARNVAELIDQIEFARWRIIDNSEERPLSPSIRDRVFFSREPLGPDTEVAFVFPGSGSHYPDMGRELALEWPEIYRDQNVRNQLLRAQYRPEMFWEGKPLEAIDADHKAIVFGQVALGTAVADLLRRFGVQPRAAIGYSLGESAALFAMGAWTDRDGMLARMNASTLFTEDLVGPCNAARRSWQLPDDARVDWLVGVVDRPEQAVRVLLDARERAYLLIVNTPSECVIGGDRRQVEAAVKELGCEFYPLRGVSCVHCEAMRPVADAYRALHRFDTTPPPGVRFYSGAWGRAYDVSPDTAADAILAQALDGIDFTKTIRAAYDDGARIFIEAGPGGSCSRMIDQILEGRAHVARSACVPGQPAASVVLRTLGQLAAERIPVDLNVLYGRESCAMALQDPKRPAAAMNISIGGAPFDVTIPTRSVIPAKAGIQGSCAKPSNPDWIPAFAVMTEVGASVHPGAESIKRETEPENFANPVVAQLMATEEAKHKAHETFLRVSERVARVMADTIALQMQILSRMGATGDMPIVAPSVPRATVAFDRNACMEFAIGRIGQMLGPDFAEIDLHPTRVRLPDKPLMLVDRILSVEGARRSMTHGRVVTEHDIHPGAWYLDGGRIPTCIAVEAGQADLFLSGYLGIDFETKGLAMYRLLDADVTFHAPLPSPGKVIRYEIYIDRFFRQGDTHFFRFHFDSTVDGKLFLTMRDGCAGFFSHTELDAGKGVVQTALDKRPMPGKRPEDWRTLTPMAAESYDDARTDALR